MDTKYVTKASEEMKTKYEKAEAKKQIVEQEIEDLRDDIKDIQMETKDLIEQARKSQVTGRIQFDVLISCHAMMF